MSNVCAHCGQPLPDYRPGSPKFAAHQARLAALKAEKATTVGAGNNSRPQAQDSSARPFPEPCLDPKDAELLALVCALGACSEKDALCVIAKARCALPLETELQVLALKACAYLRD